MLSIDFDCCMNRKLFGGAFCLVFIGVFLIPSVTRAYVFTQDLDFGDSGAEVSTLQQTLDTLGFFSYPTITGYFGSVTQTAVQAFQTAKNIVTAGTPATTGFGRVGPSTRAALNTVDTNNAPWAPPEEVTSTVFTRDLTFGMSGEDVRNLQQFLNAQGFLVAENGAGSKGNETTLFYGATQNALARFQAAHGVLPSVGFFGPLTRTKVLEIQNAASGDTTEASRETNNDSSTEKELDEALDIIFGLRASSYGSRILLSWGNVSGATSYTVRRSEDGGSFVLLESVTSPAYTDTTPIEGRRYTYAVTALNEKGDKVSKRTEIVVPVTRASVGSPSYDADATALFARMSTAPNSTRKSTINTLVTSLKTEGIWDKLDTLYIIAAHDAQAARLNWMGNDSYNLTTSGSPVFVADRGYYIPGTPSYLNWNWAPTNGVNYTQNDATFGIWTRRDIITTSSAAGSGNSGSQSLIVARSTSDVLRYRINQNTTSNAGTVSDGFGLISISRTAANTTQAYKNGAASGSAGAISSTALSSDPMNFGRVAGSYTQNQFQAGFTGASLSSTEQTALYNALNTYMTTVGVAPIVTVAASSATYATSSVAVFPDGASNATSGKGWTSTGLAYDSTDGTWWVGNHGKQLPASPTYASSVVHLSADFTTIISEITISSLGETPASVQGVAYDTSDNTLWVVNKDPGVGSEVYHISKAGSLLGTFSVPEGTNAIAYDSTRDQLIISNDSTNTITWRSKGDLSAASLSLSAPADQLGYDEDTDMILATVGSGSDGLVRFYDVATADYSGEPRIAETATLTGADAIEGVVLLNDVLYVTNDAYYHSGSPTLNRMLVYPH